jgi:hypothetical protein
MWGTDRHLLRFTNIQSILWRLHYLVSQSTTVGSTCSILLLVLWYSRPCRHALPLNSYSDTIYKLTFCAGQTRLGATLALSLPVVALSRWQCLPCPTFCALKGAPATRPNGWNSCQSLQLALSGYLWSQLYLFLSDTIRCDGEFTRFIIDSRNTDESGGGGFIVSQPTVLAGCRLRSHIRIA